MDSETPKAASETARPRLSREAIRRLLELVKPHAGILTVAAILTLVHTALILALPLMARQALDRVIATHQIASLDRLLAMMVGLVLLIMAAGYAQYVLIAYAGNRIIMEMRARLFAHLQ